MAIAASKGRIPGVASHVKLRHRSRNDPIANHLDLDDIGGDVVGQIPSRPILGAAIAGRCITGPERPPRKLRRRAPAE